MEKGGVYRKMPGDRRRREYQTMAAANNSSIRRPRGQIDYGPQSSALPHPHSIPPPVGRRRRDPPLPPPRPLTAVRRESQNQSFPLATTYPSVTLLLSFRWSTAGLVKSWPDGRQKSLSLSLSSVYVSGRVEFGTCNSREAG